MRVAVTIVVDVDLTARMNDNPPESFAEAIADELRTHLEDRGVRDAVGITAVEAITVEALNT